MNTLGATAGGPDANALIEALIHALRFTGGEPKRLVRNFEEEPTANWRARLLHEDIYVEWARHARLGRTGDIAWFDFPASVPVDARAVLEFVDTLPIEFVVLSTLHDEWIESDYFAPAMGWGHAALGWGVIAKGAGFGHAIVHRRWLEYGPFRTLELRDAVLAQLHDLAADPMVALDQAKPGHDWIAAGFLMPKHKYANDIKGIKAADGILRILVNDRKVTEREMLDACAARRDDHLANIAYVFVDEANARAHLEALWLRGLECRVADGKGERRLDENYRPKLVKPDWAR